jgi:methylated-DNA-[protein]-cysteine S-methyltransferase
MNWVFPVAAKNAHAVIAAPFGKLGVTVMDNAVHSIAFVDEAEPERLPAEPFLAMVVRELEAYFRNPEQAISLPLIHQGSAYRRRIWEELARIRAGQVRTYGALARQLSSGARAVGGACRANPWPIIVPCHRVVAANGFGGFAGAKSGTRLAVKRWLLAHEGVCL